MTVRLPDLATLLTLAYLEGLRARPHIAPSDPATTIPADDTGRAALVRLRGDRPILNREQRARRRMHPEDVMCPVCGRHPDWCHGHPDPRGRPRG